MLSDERRLRPKGWPERLEAGDLLLTQDNGLLVFLGVDSSWVEGEVFVFYKPSTAELLQFCRFFSSDVVVSAARDAIG